MTISGDPERITRYKPAGDSLSLISGKVKALDTSWYTHSGNGLGAHFGRFLKQMREDRVIMGILIRGK